MRVKYWQLKFLQTMDTFMLRGTEPTSGRGSIQPCVCGDRTGYFKPEHDAVLTQQGPSQIPLLKTGVKPLDEVLITRNIQLNVRK